MLGRRILELQHALLEEWDLIPQKDVRHLISGMPRRMQANIRAREGNTRYQKYPFPVFASNAFHFSII
nr:unnamed protein product [Callosobruchus chinensis]